MTEANAIGTQNDKPKRHRSPNFPGLPLDSAISKAQQVLSSSGLHAAFPEVIAKAWGLSAKSSSGLVAFAAVKAFGLLEKDGEKLKLSGLARDIIQDVRPNSPDREKAIQRAALTPKLHREIWDEFGGNLPADDHLTYTLIRQREFTKSGAEEFIAQFRATLAYAKLTAGSKISDERTDKTTVDAEPEVPSVGIGDYVQWTSGGTDQFPLPRRVKGLSDDKKFVFVEGTETGLPSQEVTRVDPPVRRQPLGQPTQLAGRVGMIQEAITLDEGQFVIQWPSRISAEEYKDLEEWLTIMLRRVKKAVIEKTEGEA